MERTIEEATKVIDEIVGRCVREPEYGKRVLDDPATTLAEYDPCEGIIEDFVALAEHREDALAAWEEMRAIMYQK